MIKQWLLTYRPESAVAEEFIGSNDLALRCLAVDLLAGYPVQGRFELLQKLAVDPEKDVANAAKKAVDQLLYFKNHKDLLHAKIGN